jgi:hypothetical protein
MKTVTQKRKAYKNKITNALKNIGKQNNSWPVY